MSSSRVTRVTISEMVVLAGLALLLFVLGWPRLLRSQRAANETAAVGTLKEISESEITYAATYPAVGFAGTLEELGGRGEGCVPRLERGCLLGAVSEAPYTLSGYRFAAFGEGEVARRSFYATAVPEQMGVTGQLSLCTSNRWNIRYSGGGAPALSGESCESWAIWK